ncbi:MAG: hypothetical protein ACFFD4_20090 [Candidatus Odinarchaeota archaeon]
MQVKAVNGLMLVKYAEFDDYFPYSPKFSGGFDNESLERELKEHVKDLKSSVDVLFKDKKVEWLELTLTIDYEDMDEQFSYHLERRNPDHGKVLAAISDYCRTIIRESNRLKLTEKEYLELKQGKTVQQPLTKWFN